jgi:hypothetical protein
LLTTLALSLASITPAVYTGVAAACKANTADSHLVIMVRDSAAGSAAGSAAAGSLSQLERVCASVVVVPEALAYDHSVYKGNKGEIDGNRVKKLGYLRSWLKDHVRDVVLPKLQMEVPDGGRDGIIRDSALHSVSHSVLHSGRVVVFDSDIMTFPSPAQLLAVTNYDAVCANGYEKWLMLKHYYDTFALVLYSNLHMYSSLTDVSSIVGLKQNMVYDYLRRYYGKGEVYRVDSCFGGLAIYESRVFFNECSYDSDFVQDDQLRRDVSEYVAGFGEVVCEHVVLHCCNKLLYRNKWKYGGGGNGKEGVDDKVDEIDAEEFRIGITGYIEVYREAEIFKGINNPTGVYMVVIVLFTLISIRICISKYVNGEWYKNHSMSKMGKAKNSDVDFFKEEA